MTFLAHASCPSCSSCSARADVLTEGGYLIGNSFTCDDCGTWWMEIREQHTLAGDDSIVSAMKGVSKSKREGVRP